MNRITTYDQFGNPHFKMVPGLDLNKQIQKVDQLQQQWYKLQTSEIKWLNAVRARLVNLGMSMTKRDMIDCNKIWSRIKTQ